MKGPAGDAEAMLTGIEESSGRPLRAMIEISDRCNEVCVHCYQVQGQKGEMSTAQLKAVIDELASLGVLVLTISGGEATLRRDFLEIVAHARARGFAIRLFTNGLSMSRELAEQLKALAVHVVEISLYSHRADVHDFVTGVPGSFEKTVAGIRHLVAVGVDTHVKTPSLRVNEDDVSAYLDFVISLGVTYTIDPEDLMPREGGDRAPESFSRSLPGRARLVEHERLASEEQLAPRPERSLSDTLCGAGDSFHVEANGELRPCTMLEVPLGNVLVEGASAARAHNQTLHKMLALRWRDVHGCRDCDLRAYCGRCHAAALAEVGDALAPYTSACANARQTYELTFGAPIKIATTSDHDPEIGPYRQRGAHEFDTITDVVTAEDDARARELGWIRRAGGKRSKPAPVRAGELVQIRRPGKQAKWVRVPESSAALSDKQQQATPAFGASASEAAT